MVEAMKPEIGIGGTYPMQKHYAPYISEITTAIGVLSST